MKNTKKLALTAILCAAALALLFISAFLESITVSLSAAAGLFIAVIFIECGLKHAVLAYITVSALALLVVPEKTAVFMFLMFFGYYPMYKSWCEARRRAAAEYVLKLLCFNLSLCLCWVLAGVFGFQPSLPDIPFVTVLAFVLANAVFLLYDFAFSRLISFYQKYSKRWKHK